MHQVSAKTEYGCLAVLELAGAYAREEATRARDIAQRYGIPAGFLVQILLQLKGAGLVHSTRGSSGGYRLARSPDTISLADVIEAIEGRAVESTSHARQQTPAGEVLAEVWTELAAAEQRWLRSTTLSELLKRMPSPEADMYYI